MPGLRYIPCEWVLLTWTITPRACISKKLESGARARYWLQALWWLWGTCVLTAHWDFCVEKLTLNKHEEICEHFLWYFIDTSSWLFPIFHKPRTGSFILPLLWLLGSAWCGWEEWIHNYYINALFFTMNTEMHFKIHRDSPVVSAVMLPSSSLTLLGEESMLISLVLSLFTMFSG